MATDRRKFLSLLALGVPASTSAMPKGWPFPIQHGTDENVFPLDVVSGVSKLIEECYGNIRVVRQSSSDSPAGKIRWSVEIEEPDESSKTILDRHPSVLLVYGRSLQVLYGIRLEQAGCRVTYAFDNDEAMRLYQERGPYDLVLTDLVHLRELCNRVRERKPEQAIALVESGSATNIRFHYKIPVLREGPRHEQLVRLVESAIKPRVRVLLVIAEPGGPSKIMSGCGISSRRFQTS